MTPLLYLERLIRHGSVPEADLVEPERTWGLPHAVARLSASLQSSQFGLDQAVLLRQCIRLLPPGNKIVVEKVASIVSKYFSVVGVSVADDGLVQATAFTPTWLSTSASQGADVPALQQVVEDNLIPGESWLASRLGKSAWRSHAQREAAWGTLTAPLNSTRLVGLPTGAGKSLVYQVGAAFQPGLTVLVVPTVALGIDQIKALLSTPLKDTHNPLLYTSDAHSASVLEAVRDCSCRLVIASPESIVAGRLGPVLEHLAKSAWFSRLVIDEAHIVDSWGASFRVEFQLLGARLRHWRSIAPNGLRTLLLSATFGPGTITTLRTLFAGGDVPWEDYVIQRLRPEIHYFSPGSDLDAHEHERAVSEAVMHLPRPMILYLTERDKAQTWAQRLRSFGLKRVECFHGETGHSERNRILEAWRSDEVDIVVATSAFGMGVDKSDVRSILHACYPENIDRYYQEVGRGGRDGAPCSAIALWTAADKEIGESMGPKLLSDVEKIRGRWTAMWNGAESVDASLLFRIPLWVSADYQLHQRTYNESITWNKRLLLMMERAQILRIESLSIDTAPGSEEFRAWATVRMLVRTLTLDEQLPDLLRITRAEELSAMSASRDRLDKLLTNAAPVCRLLRQHYGRETYRTCGSCSHCREDPMLSSDALPLDARNRQARTKPEIDIVYAPSIESRRQEDVVILALRRTLRANLSRRLVASEHFFKRASAMLDAAVVQDSLAYRLDLLTHETARSVRPEELVICLHDQVIHPNASILHDHGLLCAHWILGSIPEHSDVLWPFLHENQSRIFVGPSSLDDWINSRNFLLS